MKIRTWDKVKVMRWKDKWKEWKILKVDLKKNRVLVEWINIAKKHMKKSGWTPWQIVEVELTIDWSNVMLVCPHTNLPTRIWFVETKEKKWSKKFRYSKKAVTSWSKKTKEDAIIK